MSFNSKENILLLILTQQIHKCFLWYNPHSFKRIYNVHGIMFHYDVSQIAGLSLYWCTKVSGSMKTKWLKSMRNSDSTELSGRHHCRCRINVRQIRTISSKLELYSSSILARRYISTEKSLKGALALHVHRWR